MTVNGNRVARTMKLQEGFHAPCCIAIPCRFYQKMARNPEALMLDVEDTHGNGLFRPTSDNSCDRTTFHALFDGYDFQQLKSVLQC